MGLVVVSFFSAYLFIPISVGIIFMLFGVILDVRRKNYRDSGGIGFYITGFMTLLFGTIFTGAFITEARVDKAVDNFEAYYSVRFDDGVRDFPVNKNQIGAAVLFTTDGQKQCLISTDDVRYTVTCDGVELERSAE